MKTIINYFFPIALLASVFVGCKKSMSSDDPVTPPPSDNTFVAPDGYNYETEKKVSINVQLLSGSGAALQGVLVNILDKFEADGGRILYTGLTDASGRLTGSVAVPAYLKTVVVDPSYVGVMRNATVSISGGTISAILGGRDGYGGNVIPNTMSQFDIATFDAGAIIQHNLPPYTYIGKYNSLGVPEYLEKENDIIDASLLEYINASLPEQKPVPSFHPDYLEKTAETNINIVETSDVWVTFVHEGAGYLNSLFYYTYPTGSAPKTTADIKQVNVIFPNGSLIGSGGGLRSGNKVKLGRFEKGTTIGFGLVANGWDYNQKIVGPGKHVVFSDDNLNPEKDPKLRRHTVLLYDDKRKLFLTGFEDLLRESPGCDNDFNDMIFYVTSNPVTAISTTNVNPIDKPVDTDKDGVSDVYDKFPNDPTKAYIRYFPSENMYATIGFEDLWPSAGDYDMNDLVVEYKYAVISNAQNRAIEMKANYKVAAAGAAFANGFGVQLSMPPSAVKSVTGYRHTGNISLKLNSNGTESAQSKAVIIPFDNAFDMLNRAGGPVNTLPGVAKSQSVELSMQIVFNSPLDQSFFSNMIFNPFLIANRNRGYEVHLPGYLPTDLADKSLFNTRQDNTIPAQNKYYKTKENMPFALNFVEKFDHPAEKVNVREAYLKYESWVKSSGSTFEDWYSIKTSDYRASGKIID
jgi:LruC domain-containing protein